MIKIQNVEVGHGEVKKTNCQRHPQGLLESQKMFSNIPASMFDLDLLFLGETSTDIAWRVISDTGVVSLARFPARGAIIVRIEWKTEFR